MGMGWIARLRKGGTLFCNRIPAFGAYDKRINKCKLHVIIILEYRPQHFKALVF